MKKNSGLTLIELMLSIAVFSLLVASAADVYLVSTKSSKKIYTQLSTQSDGRRVISDFVRQVRGASYSALGAYPLERASSTEIIFFYDIDNDDVSEKMHYYLSGTTLRLGVTEPGGSPYSYSGTEAGRDLLYGIAPGTTIVFSYYDGSGKELSFPINIGQVKMVGINLGMQQFNGPILNLKDRSDIRILKDN